MNSFGETGRLLRRKSPAGSWKKPPLNTAPGI
uniref:Uncharacterized protein n=1 Tax=Siphoviridae sp. ctM7c3 TaxID=2826257 RepID=A0A8S5LZR8_9CAUD|nr:MAG TPA: hypothetical protein [Siphoviridae sp. ctM7c3]DAZ06424.1 MAG TPA: hypothetical protein [Caudoviricetes sp.]